VILLFPYSTSVTTDAWRGPDATTLTFENLSRCAFSKWCISTSVTAVHEKGNSTCKEPQRTPCVPVVRMVLKDYQTAGLALRNELASVTIMHEGASVIYPHRPSPAKEETHRSWTSKRLVIRPSDIVSRTFSFLNTKCSLFALCAVTPIPQFSNMLQTMKGRAHL
jgi:hypothetical protein